MLEGGFGLTEREGVFFGGAGAGINLDQEAALAAVVDVGFVGGLVGERGVALEELAPLGLLALRRCAADLPGRE